MHDDALSNSESSFGIFGLAISLILCLILTASGALSSDPGDYSYYARTDQVSRVLYDAKWLYVPYPGQWGPPVFTATAYFAMLIPTLASILESIGDYHACAEACQLPPPPIHAVNRGVFVEGLGSIFAGVFGGGGSITSYSQNTGVISITKSGSRFIFQVCSLFLLIFGVIGKFGAALTAVPTAIVGGMLLTGVSMIFGVAFGNLSKVDLKSSRNQMVIGLAVIVGMIMPIWIDNSGSAIKSGNELFDDVLKILLRTSMFTCGMIACILDNTFPGRRSEKGMLTWHKDDNMSNNEERSAYELPYIMPWLRRQKCCFYIPIMPVYRNPKCKSCKKSKQNQQSAM